MRASNPPSNSQLQRTTDRSLVSLILRSTRRSEAAELWAVGRQKIMRERLAVANLWSGALLVLVFVACSAAPPALAPAPCPTEPVRAGGNVSLPVAKHRVEPTRPVGVTDTGRVILQMVIGTDGVAKDIVVLSAPHPSLGEVSAQAARSWKFQPAMCAGSPVEAIFNIQMTFH